MMDRAQRRAREQRQLHPALQLVLSLGLVPRQQRKAVQEASLLGVAVPAVVTATVRTTGPCRRPHPDQPRLPPRRLRHQPQAAAAAVRLPAAPLTGSW